ncbi:MAG TPA: DUF3761 domain-containing protein [Granulicella sp.]
MKTMLKMFALLFVMHVGAHAGFAQAPAGAPAGATGLCKDGTYATSQSKSAGCRGHNGVKDWYLGATAAPASSAAAPAAKPAPTPAAAPAPVAKPAPSIAATPAPGGGAGKVWLNTSTNVYHCSTDRFYGKTKAGSYMTEADAKAKGAHPDHGKACN